MSTPSNSSFPLLATDQADVIRIFLELMRDGDRSGRTAEASTATPIIQRSDSDRMWFPGELPDLG